MKIHVRIHSMITGFFLIMLFPVFSTAQYNWEKYEYNPVMEGIEGAWNQATWNPVVIHEDNLFKMWYMGRYWQNDTRQIGYATSTDGINWNMEDYPDPVIPGGAIGEWNHHKYPGTVLRINDTIKMWYAASIDSQDNGYIGYAWAVVENNWTEWPVPVFSKGEPGTWDDLAVMDPKIIYDAATSVYHMYYSGLSSDGVFFDIGHATSMNGTNWTRDYFYSPVLVTGQNGMFYDTWIMPSGLIFYNDTLHMYFGGYDGAYFPTTFDGYFRIGHAWSTDYVNWTIDPLWEPVVDVGIPGEWDDVWAWSASVLIHDGRLKMWYMGKGITTSVKIGYALGDMVDIGAGLPNLSEPKNNDLGISPNPFTSQAIVSYVLHEKSRIQLDVYNLNGLLVSSLVSEVREQGKHEAIFDDNQLQPGIYFCVLKTKEGILTKKIIKQ